MRRPAPLRALRHAWLSRRKRAETCGVILMYHRIAPIGVDPWELAVTPEHFAQHLDVLRRDASPLPLHTYRSDANKLYMHIAFRVEYKQTWQMMPALKHVTEAEAGLLWQWMRAASSAPLTRYSPTKY